MIGTLKGIANFARPTLMSVLMAIVLQSSAPVYADENDLPADMLDRTKYGVRAYEEGDTRHAFDTFYKLMGDATRKFGANDGHMARVYVNMGEAYCLQQQYNYAEDCFKRGLNIAEKGYGANSVQTVPALINWAQMYVAEGKYALAQTLFKRALNIVNKAGNLQLMAYAAVIETDLGKMYFDVGNLGFAEQHFKRAVSLATESLGANHKWTTVIGGMYAACLRESGKKKEAKAIEQAAVAKANETLSPIFICNKQIQLADSAMADKRYDDAEAALKLGLDTAKELSLEPMVKAILLTRYGELQLGQNKPALAVEKLKVAQVIADATLPINDKSVLAHAKVLADLEKRQDHCADAEPLYKRLLANSKKLFGPESPEYLASLIDLADLYNRWAQFTKAEEYYAKVLELQEKQFGSADERLVPTLVALAAATQGNTSHFTEINARAEGYYKRAIDLASKKFGKNSKEVGKILEALSHYYQRQFEWNKAMKVCKQVIACDEKTFGPESPETMKALEYYVVVLRAAGLRSEAEPVEAKIAKMKKLKNAED